MRYDGPLIVQENKVVLLDERHPEAEEARELLGRFSDLTRQSGDLHTYRMTPLSVWNAAASGMTAGEMIACLLTYSRYDVPEGLIEELGKLVSRYGKIKLVSRAEGIALVIEDDAVAAELRGLPYLQAAARKRGNALEWRIPAELRGLVKQELARLGYPVIDLVGYIRGEKLTVSLLNRTNGGSPFALRDYQERAVEHFYREGDALGGSGVLVLPCGAGKTVVGLAALARLNCAALILTSSVTSVRQWRSELLDKTSLTEAEIGEYTGHKRQVRPVTIATYQMMTYRQSKEGEYAHMRLFGERSWGLIIYDEVHLLPAPVFRMTADIQATRRLGLTAALVREDGREADVFSLIGPRRYDVSWKAMESRGWIASVACTEIRIPLPEHLAGAYGAALPRAKHRIAAENPAKDAAVGELLRLHVGRSILVIGQYIRQLKGLAAKYGAPLLTGETPHDEREVLYARFRAGDVPVIIVSKVANFAVDLPDAAVAIQVSGSFGSRQEETQRIGRILRPKRSDNTAWFYTLVSEGTKETEYALKRRQFMIEQGYEYRLVSRSAACPSSGEAQRL